MMPLIAALTFGLAFWWISVSLSARLSHCQQTNDALRAQLRRLEATEAGLRQDIRNSAARDLIEDVPTPMVRVIAGGCEYVVRLADLPCSERVM